MKTKLNVGSVGWFYINPNDITQGDDGPAKCIFSGEIRSIEVQTKIDADGETPNSERYTIEWGWDKAVIDSKDVFGTEQEAISRAKEDIEDILSRRARIDAQYRSALEHISGKD